MIDKFNFKKIAEEYREPFIEVLVKSGLDKQEAEARVQAIIDNSVRTATNFEQSVKSTPVVE